MFVIKLKYSIKVCKKVNNNFDENSHFHIIPLFMACREVNKQNSYI